MFDAGGSQRHARRGTAAGTAGASAANAGASAGHAGAPAGPAGAAVRPAGAFAFLLVPLSLLALVLPGCVGVDTRYQEATLARRRGDIAAAEAAYRAVLARQPSHAAAHFYLGYLENRRGDREAAAAHYRAALAGKLPDPEWQRQVTILALNNLAYTLAEEGRSLDEAEALARRALQLDPDRAGLLDTLALVLLKQGRVAEAHSLLVRAATFAPEDDAILEHLADASLARGDRQEALAALREALATRPLSRDRVLHLEERLRLLRFSAPLPEHPVARPGAAGAEAAEGGAAGPGAVPPGPRSGLQTAGRSGPAADVVPVEPVP